MTPHVQSSDLETSDGGAFGTLMESYASIRSTIDYNLPDGGAVLQLTSSRPGEGKSTTAVVLAELFARLGRKTLLIDADLRKPSISKLLEIDRPAAGLSEVLLGKTSFEEARLDHVHENLSILAVAQPTPDPVALLSSYKMQEFLEQRRKEYSLILIDSSPVLGLADAPQVAKIVDATIFVIEANRTSFGQASSAIKRLQYVGARISGAILSKYRSLEAGEDYDYHYTYYRYGED
jgi:capsular exopolysaccharide synthesis family protein